jgi:transcriptional regulator with XRE-family HTH domain
LILAARQAAGLTQIDLAAKLGVAQGVVSLWERGRAPDTATLWRIADALEVSVLYDGELRFVNPASIG